MKSLKRTALTLRQEQVRVLAQTDLARIVGGDPPSALCPTYRFCTHMADSRRSPPDE